MRGFEPKNNYWTPLVAPTTSDNLVGGYEPGSEWLYGQTIYKCVYSNRTTATWRDITDPGLVSFMSAGSLWNYRADTSATSGYPGDGDMLWDNATQTSAANLLFAHMTFDGLDVDRLLGFLATGNTLIVQDANASANFQSWTVGGSPTNTNPGTTTSYWTVPVTLASSGGTGATGFANNHRLIVFVVR